MSVQPSRLVPASHPSSHPAPLVPYVPDVPAPWPPPPGGDELPGDEVVRLSAVAGLLRRRWPTLALALGVAAVAAGAYLARAVPVYEAQAVVRVDAKQGTLPAVYTSPNDVNRVASEAEVLRSRVIANAAVLDAGLRLRVDAPRTLRRSALLAAVHVTAGADTGRLRLVRAADGTMRLDDLRPGGRSMTLTPGRPTGFGGVGITLADGADSLTGAELHVVSAARAADLLQEEVQIGRAGLETNVIQLRYRNSDPVLAKQVLDAWISEYLNRRQAGQHAEVHSTAIVLRQQIDTLTRELASAEDAFRAYRERVRTVNPQAEATTQITRFANLQAERTATEAERQALASLVNEVRAQAAAPAGGASAPDATVPPPSPYRRLLGFPTILRNPSSAQMLTALTQAEAARAELLLRRTPADPDIAQLTQRVRDVETQIGDLAGTYLQGLTNQVAATDQGLARFGAQLDRVPGREVEYARLERQPAVLSQLVSTLQTRLKEAQVAEAVADPTVQVVDPAYVAEKPVAPKPALVLTFALFVGALVGGAGAVVREQRDRSVRSRTDVARAVAAPVLGVIPDLGRRAGTVAALTTSTNAGTTRSAVLGSGVADDAYTRLQLSLASSGGGLTNSLAPASRVTLVTSAMPRDGKSTTAFNLALTFARRGVRTLLVDADLRRGTLAAALGVRPPFGLIHLLAGAVAGVDAVVACEPEAGVSLDFVSSGGVVPDAGRRLTTPALRELIEEWRDAYDAVVIDSPPLGAVSDAAVLARLCDGVLLVAREDVTPADVLARATEELRRARVPVLGAVLNDADAARDTAYAAHEYYATTA